MAELVKPSPKYKDSFIEAVAEGSERDTGFKATEEFFSEYLEAVEKFSKGVDLPTGYVPATDYWLIEDETYIGRVSVRHSLTEALRLIGGHIGYTIRPSKRRMGFGTLILKLVLPRAKELGLAKVLVTCDEANIGSRKIIEKNGGVLEDRFEIPGQEVAKLRFWIQL